MSTELRAFFTRRLDLPTISLYALLLGLVIAVLVLGGMIVADQVTGL